MIWTAFWQNQIKREKKEATQHKHTHTKKWAKGASVKTFLLLLTLFIASFRLLLFYFFLPLLFDQKLSMCAVRARLLALLTQKIEHLFDSIMRLIVCNPNFYQIRLFTCIETIFLLWFLLLLLFLRDIATNE